ncbi:MAG TPA: inositol monophosphatase family protein [Blastocatellia bacterium]|nr:inositol monophosphatase family protein [Blastocatellia bacterium]
MTGITELAIRAAREAGAILRDYAARGFEVTNKGRINLLTEADLASEKHIKELIASHYPTHRIIAEESGVSDHRDFEYCWIIDPLDGTTNFAHGFPCFAVSIGIEHKGQPVAGAIYDPSRDEMFAAERGAGATLNGQRIRVSDVEQLERALVVSGFPYDVRERMDEYLPAWRAFLEHAQGVRRFGAAAIDMAYVACGRLDGFWEYGLNAWDMAAGAVIVEEAGGRMSKLDGSPFDPYVPSMLCTNGQVHEEMLAVLRSLRA